MGVVVSDASPLICLAAIRHFDLLRLLYGDVLIPEAVWREITPVRRHLPLLHLFKLLPTLEARAGCKSQSQAIVRSSRS
jgi:predicted nucleic acid-binding protein